MYTWTLKIEKSETRLVISLAQVLLDLSSRQRVAAHRDRQIFQIFSITTSLQWNAARVGRPIPHRTVPTPFDKTSRLLIFKVYHRFKSFRLIVNVDSFDFKVNFKLFFFFFRSKFLVFQKWWCRVNECWLCSLVDVVSVYYVIIMLTST